jgi:hypothetical protein
MYCAMYYAVHCALLLMRGGPGGCVVLRLAINYCSAFFCFFLLISIGLLAGEETAWTFNMICGVTSAHLGVIPLQVTQLAHGRPTCD